MSAKQSEIEKITARIAKCRECSLCEKITNTVPGSGSADAKILFIGEAPGKAEDQRGEPFVGAAGKFLNVLLESVGLDREKVFVANVVKCRPPENRDPTAEEVAACWKYLELQIKTVQPLLIVTLGRHSLSRFVPDVKISEVHGEVKSVKGIWSDQQMVFPMYHPAAALYNPALRSTMLADMAKIPVLLKKIAK